MINKLIFESLKEISDSNYGTNSMFNRNYDVDNFSNENITGTFKMVLSNMKYLSEGYLRKLKLNIISEYGISSIDLLYLYNKYNVNMTIETFFASFITKIYEYKNMNRTYLDLVSIDLFKLLFPIIGDNILVDIDEKFFVDKDVYKRTRDSLLYEMYQINKSFINDNSKCKCLCRSPQISNDQIISFTK